MTMICQTSDDRAPEPANDRGGRGTQRRDGVGQRRRLGSFRLESGIQADGEPGGDAAQQLGLAAEPAEPTPHSVDRTVEVSRDPAMTRALCGREQGGTDRVRVIDPSAQVGGRDHDMGAAAAGTASASQPHPRPASIPAANGPWAGASPAPQPTTAPAPAPERARRKTPLRGRLVECADHLWLASRLSTLPDSGSSVNGAAGVALCRRSRVIAIRPDK